MTFIVIAGLSIVVPVFVLCITGFLMTYDRQIEGWIDLRKVNSAAAIRAELGA